MTQNRIQAGLVALLLFVGNNSARQPESKGSPATVGIMSAVFEPAVVPKSGGMSVLWITFRKSEGAPEKTRVNFFVNEARNDKEVPLEIVPAMDTPCGGVYFYLTKDPFVKVPVGVYTHLDNTRVGEVRLRVYIYRTSGPDNTKVLPSESMNFVLSEPLMFR